MKYAPNERPLLLKTLLPGATASRIDSAAKAFLQNLPAVHGAIRLARQQGILSVAEYADIARTVREVAELIEDLQRREVTVFHEGAAYLSDTSLKVEIDKTWVDVSNYLDSLAEALSRLRARGHLSTRQYRWLESYFENLRRLHREIYQFLDNMYL